MMPIESAVAALGIEIDGLRLEPRVYRRGEWSRKTTVIHLLGAGEEGVGEDVTWATVDQERFVAATRQAPVTGVLPLGEFFERVAAIDLFPEPPARSDARLFRRWGFESAARDPRLVSFVTSLGLGDPPSVDPILCA